MEPLLADVIGPILALLGLGSMVLIGMKMRYTHLQRTRTGQIERGEIERLTEDVASLREDCRAMREEFVDLYERVEFTERLLARGRFGDEDVGALPQE